MKIGLDMVEVARIEKSLENPRFKTGVFSREEQRFLESKRWNPQSAAANFAAKEAFSKALGTGVRGFSLCEVSVLRDELGAPFFVFHGKALALTKGKQFSVSLTHTDTLAQAVVLMTEEASC